MVWTYAFLYPLWLIWGYLYAWCEIMPFCTKCGISLCMVWNYAFLYPTWIKWGYLIMYGVKLCLSVPSVTQMGIFLCMVWNYAFLYPVWLKWGYLYAWCEIMPFCTQCDSNGDILMYGVKLCLSVPNMTQMGIPLCMVWNYALLYPTWLKWGYLIMYGVKLCLSAPKLRSLLPYFSVLLLGVFCHCRIQL